MKQTYNPILEVTELSRLRFGAPVRPPELGTALVLERMTGPPIVVRERERVPDARTGNYCRMHRVDMARRSLSFTVQATSADAIFSFAVTLSLACQITDPVTIVRDGVRDMTAALQSSLTTIIDQAAGLYEILFPRSVEDEIHSRLNGARPLPDIWLGSFAARVSVDEDVLRDYRTIKLQETWRRHMRSVVDGGPAELEAQALTVAKGDPTAELNRSQQVRAKETESQLAMLEMLLRNGADLGDLKNTPLVGEALRTFFGTSEKAVPSVREGLRERLERKAQKVIGDESVVEGNAAGGPGPRQVRQPSRLGEQEVSGVPQEEPVRRSRVRGLPKPGPRPTGH